MAIVKEIGTITFLGEIKSGVSQNGNPWANQQVIFDVAGYNGSFRKVLVVAGTDRVQELQQFPLGSRVEFGYQVRAREYQGKWYNNVELYSITPAPVAQPQQGAQQAAQPQYQQQAAQPAAPQYPAGQQGGYAPQQGVPQQNVRQRPPVQSQPQIPPQPAGDQFPAFDSELGF